MPTFICFKSFKIFLTLLLTGIFSVGSFSAHSQDEFSGTILRGDKLTITVLEQEELNGAYTVDSDGGLEFPLISEAIAAEGLTHNELAARLKQELEKEYFYQATVIVKTFEEKDVEAMASEEKEGFVYVYGMVGSPGVVKIPEGENLTVSKVIIMSGGFKDFANRKSVRLTRKSPGSGDAETTIVNVVNVLLKGKLEEDIAVRDGDIIVVPEKFFNF
jgi:polysaccharide export outer membrane protein